MFVPGQRWISTAEPELGLGTVLRIEGRSVQVLYAKSGVMRHYAQQSAPLLRAAFRVGQRVTGQGTSLVIEDVLEQDGLLIYRGSNNELVEGALDDEQSISQADERLLSGRVDPVDQFELRYEALQRRAAARHSPAWGLNPARVELLDHQLRVVAEACRRPAPRVLLADEVGLGKTIEAGMIVARQLASGRARRVLVVVPENLLHQWFVELLRRFNLAFALFDESRAAALEGDGGNPFEAEQLVITSLEFLLTSKRRAEQLSAAGWDMLVVDEAHHLQWTPQQQGPGYTLIEALSTSIASVILLTATPEQLGRSGHFARLRLLDPARFHDLDTYLTEADSYIELSGIAEQLQQGQALRTADCEKLFTMFADDAALRELVLRHTAGEHESQALLSALIDRHGTGRVMFRNRRDVIGGFPERLPQLDVLPADSVDDARRQALLEEFQSDIRQPSGDIEFAYEQDPRLHWLLSLLDTYPDDKFLLICRTRSKVQALDQALATSGVKFARFHEDLGLMQRDRNAAWFAEADGARLLLSSEIGSEGRNFQFAHRLVLWDLPLDPDLLEQRIGRLDRIGRAEKAIHIHLAVVRGTAQHLLARWYHEGINAFAASPADGRELLRSFGTVLSRVAMDHARGTDDVNQEFDSLIAETAAVHQSLSQRMHEGRDRLLELATRHDNSEVSLRQALQHADHDEAGHTFAQRLLERFGVQIDDLGGEIIRLDPEYLSTDALAGFEGGVFSATFDRAVALRRDDLPLLRIDHPLLQGALDLLLGSEQGNAAFMMDAALTSRQALLQAVFVLECVADVRLDAARFLPPTPLLVTVDTRQRELPRYAPSPDALTRAAQQPIDVGRYRKFLVRLLPPMLAKAENLARARGRNLAEQAQHDAQTLLGNEHARLLALRTVNPAVRQADIDGIAQELTNLNQALPESRVRLDSLRFVVSPDFLELR